MDGMMLEILREQKNKGKKKDNCFLFSKDYRKVVAEIDGKYFLNIDMIKVLNYLKTHKEQMIFAKEIELKNRIG